MIPAASFAGKRVSLFGLGGSGIATAHALIEGGAEVLAWDDNPDSVAKAAAAGIATGDLHTADWATFSAFVLSPGVPLTHPKPHWTVELARGSGVEIIGDVELFCRERTLGAPAAPFIAITGTNGKSTTTALTAHILKASGRDTQMGGNIGRAVMTLDPPQPDRHYVVECSSYQIDLAPSINPTAGILLNLTPDHLDRHGTMQHYASIKERLVAGSETAIVGIDDSWCAQIAERLERAGRHVIRISKRLPLTDGYFADGTNLMEAVHGRYSRVAFLEGIGSLRGQHNAQNALAAVAACLKVGLDLGEIQSGLESFPGLAHRMEQVGRKDHVLFVNDSKATNADAAAPALSSFSRIYWIAGGLPKEGGIEPLRGFFPRIAKAYLIGEAAPAFSATLGEAVPYEISGTLAAAVEHAAHDAAKDDGGEAVVLLSPACASFDQFKNFEVRGEAFRQAANAIEGVKPIGGAR
ncbi:MULTISPECIES: UDP-N-acetylmuramoyl-L-alanine--D-glutamate ligase [unclassified Mesorhizobium]|uniref:UDP-N-acetylmuramoyl-L-alanine--D-glutamate ligase n=1 Tax=unclassified Mesorhizobium TaxID=325217 RepID=UPI00112EE9AD|nr:MULTISPECIES: UDP-N-acetylmuramoyl-L-alanine--D-glutamate ligase [unclassified Mesorhizobium]TPJ47769.1 UDP-N-acetylmuramoyl-L-alanine--D-glutamate ligase [Mesorhizobium sp. B2-6-6]MBZ9896721.1 UDP-N-acetylmuramoyl-L-alanine--D-glutamate ligase [Mesorhizobium sp. BR1-1-6]MBZ9957786.1 UDP-N-acetylmuramoyl-L-alanine--D-glutamate ligase [Mesorhizobium sp. BR1-1-14]MBZ9982920.1 UDP-N-acetylmuramoyl-L-alanine--D-glutamate ligase [Mesorhizobium sp. BR-1-1-8]MCA0001257.1 UDP-N-acetylmuramoyl-L-ala